MDSSPIVILAAKLPEAPFDLTENPVTTTAYQIGITWSEGSYNGGTPILDYRVSYKL